MSETSPEPSAAELTVIVVSYNTRALTLKCLETLHAATRRARFRVVVFDNDSRDGSADAIAAAFPQVELIRAPENIGFARANNAVAARATTEWLLLLNPDTEVHEGAVDNLLDFAKANPQAGVTGGRTVFPDGTLNAASCWARITPWSLTCQALGLSALFPGSAVFNPEGMGGWARDSEREVDIVVGCLLMIRRALWNELGGFDTKYFMYGEESDLCLRARRLGYRPRITPTAQIMHLVGASATRADKTARVAKARVTLMRDHWPPWLRPYGRLCFWLWIAGRRCATAPLALLPGAAHKDRAARWRAVWDARRDWMEGYASAS